MSICIISDHIIMLKQNFITILSILIKYSLNMKGGASAPKAPPPGSAPAHATEEFGGIATTCDLVVFYHWCVNS